MSAQRGLHAVEQVYTRAMPAGKGWDREEEEGSRIIVRAGPGLSQDAAPSKRLYSQQLCRSFSGVPILPATGPFSD